MFMKTLSVMTESWELDDESLRGLSHGMCHDVGLQVPGGDGRLQVRAA